VLLRAVPFGAPPAACLALGEDLAGRARRVAMLVMGDGSARRSTKAPGYLDSRAQRYDADVAAALASADPGQLARLDPALAADLLVAGRAAWQVLAGAAAGSQFRGQLHRVAAPYGVGYFVASWKPI
jgi:aromatic ring-opening dioxygenase LigB subunit